MMMMNHDKSQCAQETQFCFTPVHVKNKQSHSAQGEPASSSFRCAQSDFL